MKITVVALRDYCKKIINEKTEEQIRINSFLAERQIKKVFFDKIIQYLEYLLVNLSLMLFPFIYSKITNDIAAIYAGYGIITFRMVYNFTRLTLYYLSFVKIVGFTINPITVVYQLFYGEIYTKVSYELSKMNFLTRQVYKLGYGRSIGSISQSFFDNLKKYFLKSLSIFLIQAILAWSSYIIFTSQYITPFLYSAGELNIFSATIYPFYYSIRYLFSLLFNISFLPFFIFISIFIFSNGINAVITYALPYKKVFIFLSCLLVFSMLLLFLCAYLFNIFLISPIIVAFLFTYLETTLFVINKRHE